MFLKAPSKDSPGTAGRHGARQSPHHLLSGRVLGCGCNTEVRGNWLLELRLHKIGFEICLPFLGKSRFKKLQDKICCVQGSWNHRQKKKRENKSTGP